MAWQAIACSERGVGHIKNGTPCQDSVAHQIILNNQVVIGAVSDGMGSAAHSDLGSKIAVKTAIDYLSKNNFLNNPLDNAQARSYFNRLLKNVVTKIQTEAKNQGYSVRDLACTLLAFVATPNWLAAMQVGDGLIVICPQPETYQLLFQPQKGEYGNETVPVTSSEASQKMQCQVKTETIKFICAATDGIEHISLEKAKIWQAYCNFFEPLERQIMRSNKSQSEKEKILRDFLNSEQVNQETDDDKTVLLCIQNGSNTSNPVTQPSSFSQPTPTPELSQPRLSRYQTSDDTQEIHNNLKQQIEQLKQEVALLIPNEYPDFEIKERTRIKTLEICFNSNQPLDKRHLLNLLVPLNIYFDKMSIKKVLDKMSIKKVRILNKNPLERQPYWNHEINLSLLPFLFKKIVTIAAIAIVMTLICIFIKIFTPNLLAILVYFLYNSLILIFIFESFAKKNRRIP